MEPKNKAILIAVLLAALFLRVWQLENIPAGFYSDEAAIGYDSYSMLLTGKDFHGHSFPLFFESFGEWKNPVYIYAAIPSVAIFGPNAWATRLPAALFGLLAVLGLFLLAREFFSEELALVAAGFAAVSPWALQFSRVAFEASALPALFLFGFWCLLKGFEKREYWFASAVLFGLSLYSYGTGRLFTPLFLVGFGIVFRREIWEKRKHLVAPLALFLVLALPLVWTAVSSPSVLFSRANTISIVAPGHSLGEFWSNYPQYFSADFLVNNGDANARHSPPGYGQLLWFMGPLVTAGMIASLLFLDKKSKLLFLWLFLFPVAASLTFEGSPHATRSIIGIGLFELFAVAGCAWLYAIVKKHAGKAVPFVAGAFLLLAGANAGLFLNDYFTKYPGQSAAWFEGGLEQAFGEVSARQGAFDKVFVTRTLDQGLTYAAFFTKLDPRVVQAGSYGKFVQSDDLGGSWLRVARDFEVQKGRVVASVRNAAGTQAWRVEASS
ncbi:MAG TPA: glycosyltransferase family 39 protein [Candidatus Norongarragalinales archaeon]|nr:glycosyltransferase family 39 protein [Candidatus Norongarragalinales archaeon]